MIIEILTSKGSVFTIIETNDAEFEFAHAQSMYGTTNAASWREYTEEQTVDSTSTAKITELKTARNKAEAATPFTYDSSKFDYDSLSRERINAVVSASIIAAQSGTATSTVLATWTLYDNTTRDMTIADWMAFHQAEVARSSECHATYRTLKSQIESIKSDVSSGVKTEAEAISAIQAISWA